ncbi:MAG: helix-turn-helix domain-containing protein [Bacteroidales bacterium]|jgi:predicted DNA-binding transcriptional regulator YafY|nr:helix-turn-helix domain-containing protein [Bacteroidales bacterium]
MADQPRLARLLRLLMMLSGSFGNSVNEIARQLEITQRTAYRYIETLRDAGFIITRNNNMIRVDKESPYL